ncbi:MAG: DUF192 domain-containing protein [Patescibacteria group bacterium]|jgi:hypothetical protein
MPLTFKNKFYLSVVFLIIVVFLVLFVKQNFFEKNHYGTVRIGGRNIAVEIADNTTRRNKGLSGRAKLDSNTGMLFIYPDYAIRSFWMKNMFFSLDIIWIKDNRIVGVEKNVSLPIGAYIPVVKSSDPVNAVLEVNAGFCEKNNIKIGDAVSLLTGEK